MTQDRLMRFTPLFHSSDDAERYAIAEAMGYIARWAAPVCRPI